jgi:hypothetical protein
MLMAASPAFAAISLQLAANYDATRNSKYPTGNKPQGGTCPPTGWTAVSLGDAGGDICGSATEFDVAASGTHQISDSRIVHKDAGNGDVQLKARITDSYTGTTQNFSGVGIQLREAATDTAYAISCHSLRNSATAIQAQYGANGSYTTANGAAGQARPRYVALTYDLSTGDLKCHASADGTTYTEVASTNRAMSDVLAAVAGWSDVTTETLSATLDNIALGSTITVYTPAGGGGGGPTLVTPIVSQTGVQGIAFVLKDSGGVDTTCASNFSGATSYAVSGLHVSTGITFNTSTCAFGGTPNANDVGTDSITVTATNAGGSTPETFQLTVSAVPGDTFLIPNTVAGGAASRTYNCETDGGASDYNGDTTWTDIGVGGATGPPRGGDVIELEGGLHLGGSGSGPTLMLVNCQGTAAQDLIIRNQTTATAPAEIRRATTTTGSFIFVCRHCSAVDITGMGGYSGIEPGELGVTDDHTENRVSYGILVSRAATAGRPSAYLKLDGTSAMRTDASASFAGTAGTGGVTVRGVKVDGVDRADSPAEGSVGICFDLNDHDYKRASYASGVYREDIVWTNLYGEFCGVEGGEGFYIGANASLADVPLRNVEVSHSIMESTSSECVNIKDTVSSGTGANVLHHLHLYGCGLGPSNNGAGGISLQNPGNFHIYQNYIEDAGEGVTIKQSSPPSGFSVEITIENNIFNEIDQLSSSLGQGIRATRASTSVYNYSPFTIRNNTFANVREECVYANGPVTVDIHANIFAACAEGASSVGVTAGGTATNNLTGTVASFNFVNQVLDNFHIGDDSPACNAQTTSDPDDDYDGDARAGTADIGADENATCD